MSLAGFEVDQLHVSFPRVSGGEPVVGQVVGRALTFSPRERG